MDDFTIKSGFLNEINIVKPDDKVLVEQDKKNGIHLKIVT